MPDSLDAKDVKFLKERRRFASKGYLLGMALLAGVLAFTAWMYWAHPRLANPFHVFRELEADAIPQSMLEIMAAMLPIMVTTVFVVLAMLLPTEATGAAIPSKLLQSGAAMGRSSGRSADGGSQA